MVYGAAFSIGTVKLLLCSLVYKAASYKDTVKLIRSIVETSRHRTEQTFTGGRVVYITDVIRAPRECGARDTECVQ